MDSTRAESQLAAQLTIGIVIKPPWRSVGVMLPRGLLNIFRRDRRSALTQKCCRSLVAGGLPRADREVAREALARAGVSCKAGCSADLSLACREARNIFSFNCHLLREILQTLSSGQEEFSASAFPLYDLHISILVCIVAGLRSYSYGRCCAHTS